MSWKRQVKVLHAPDGNRIYRCIGKAFAYLPEVDVNDNANDIPETHQAAVGVFIITKEAEKDLRLVKSLEQLLKNDFPVLPVVENIDTYDFSKLPKLLGQINAVGWNEGNQEGEKAIINIKQYLGLTSFKGQCRVFISYCRSDGKDVAEKVNNSLQEKKYRTFLDTEDIAGGQNVQQTIMKAISDRDFVLLIDSPGAAKSKWVKAEITRAITSRVTVCALRLSDKQYFPLFREMPAMVWKKRDRYRYVRLENFINSVIASKETFDLLCDRIVREVAGHFHCDIHRVQKRKLRLSKQVNSDKRNLSIEYEDAPLSLDRLYRLHMSYENSSNLDSAILIHNGLPLWGLEQKAVDWAKGDEPLQVLTLTGVRKAVKFTMES